jgi:hypothetical protein
VAPTVLAAEAPGPTDDLGPALEEPLRKIDLYRDPEPSKARPLPRQVRQERPDPEALLLARLASGGDEFRLPFEPREERGPALTSPAAQSAAPGGSASAPPPLARFDAVWLDWPLPAAAIPGGELAARLVWASGPEEEAIQATAGLTSPKVDSLNDAVFLIPPGKQWEEASLVALAIGGLALWPREKPFRAEAAVDEYPGRARRCMTRSGERAG